LWKRVILFVSAVLFKQSSFRRVILKNLFIGGLPSNNLLRTKNMGWTEERVDQLTQLWIEGLSASEIGRRLEVSKNAVIGKAHRLGLPSRPSPIKRSVS
jgi:hypothetical protein